MDATLGASTTHGYLLLLPANSTTFFSPLLAALLAVTSLLWLVPGGPAWALSRCRRPARRAGAPRSPAPRTARPCRGPCLAAPPWRPSPSASRVSSWPAAPTRRGSSCPAPRSPTAP
ncbi:hypothetical protein EE612_018135 [Oryza sativa]|nr:hypothetical protein EE612_018135 [Oryza sativa]